MKPKNLLLSFCILPGSFMLAGSTMLVAAQTANRSTASQSTPNASGAASGQADSTPQSFTVQPAASQNEEPTFVLRSTTRRVVVDVVVTGPDGKPVSGLTQKDFSVFEDRKPQPVRGFEIHTPEDDRSMLPAAPLDLPAHTFVNLESKPASGPPVVMVLDFMNTPIADQAYAHEQIVRFVEKKPASTEVAIFALGDSLSMVQGFTTDTNRLLAVLRTKAAQPHMTAASENLLRAQTTLDAFLDIGRLLSTINGRKNLLWFSGSFDMLVLPKAQDVDQGSLFVESSPGSPSPGPGAAVTAANMMPSAATMGATEGSASGFSGEIGSMTVLQDKLRQVAMALAVSQTAVYPVDVRGLKADPGFSASAAAGSSMTANPKGAQGTPGMPTTPGGLPASVQSQKDFIDSLNATHATMEEIAEATGGHAFENTNGIAAAAGMAINQGASYYTLNYAPSNLNFDGGLRTIHVSLNKPGYKLTYRSAYYAVDPATVTPDAGHDGSITAAMLHGAPEAQGLIFKAQIDPDGPPAAATSDSPLAVKLPENIGEKTKKNPDFLSGMVQSYSIRLAIVAQQLQFTQMQDGRHRAALEIAVYAYAADGRKIGGTMQNLEASLPAAVYTHALQDGMYHNLKVQLPVEAASLRIAISNPEAHRVGSLEVALPLPPAQQAKVSAPVTP